jgi:hypothetical protein
MNPRTTGILFLVALALGAFVWFYEIEGEEARQEAKAAEKRLFPGIESADVDEIALTTRDGTTVRLRRGDDGWSLVEPLAFPADAFATDGIASNLADLSSVAVLENPQPLEEYGLADGARVVRFHAGGEEHVLRLGNKTPVGGNSYAQVDGRDDVVTIPTFKATSFDKTLTDLRERRIMALDTAAVQSVEVHWPDGAATLERVAAPEGEGGEGGDAAEEPSQTWRLTAPIEGRADDEVVDRLVSDLSFLRATGFVDDPSPELLAGFEKPAFDVLLRGKPGEDGTVPSWHLRVGPVYEGDKRLVQTDSPSLFTIAAERINDFPRTLVSYRFKRLAEFRIGDAAQVDFFFHPRSGDPVAITARRSGDGWTASPEAVVPGKVARLVSELSDLEAIDIVSEHGSEEQLQALGLSPPNTILTVFGEPKQEAEGEEPPSLPRLAEIHLGKVEGSEWIAASAAGDPAIYKLSYELAEHVPVSLDAFRNRFESDELEPGAQPAPDAPPDRNPEFPTPSEESP